VLRSLTVRGSGSTKQSINNDPRMKQLRDASERCPGGLQRAVQIGPRGWDQRTRAVGQYEQEHHFAPSLLPAKNLQLLALEGVMWTHDGDPLRVAVEVVVMGIVSCLPSTEFIISG